MSSPQFVQIYAKHIECDFCGQLTRGRVYQGSNVVVCGACNKPLMEFEDEEDKLWEALTRSAGAF